MKMTIEQFRELAKERRAAVKQGGARYTKSERAWAVGWAQQSGLSRTRAARELGIAIPRCAIGNRAGKQANDAAGG
jgi:hypothetical protein